MAIWHQTTQSLGIPLVGPHMTPGQTCGNLGILWNKEEMLPWKHDNKPHDPYEYP